MINTFGINVDVIAIVLQTAVIFALFLHKQLHAFLAEVRRVNI